MWPSTHIHSHSERFAGQVVWEDCIADGEGNIKEGWVRLFEKHNTRFTIGSGTVGQFIGPNGANHLKPDIVKYWKLGEVLSEEATQNIIAANAERLWFEGWEVPDANSDGRFKRQEPCMRAETLHMHQGKFVWEEGDLY